MTAAARCLVVLGAVVAAAGQAAAPGRDAAASSAQADQLLVVDCLLPGQVRMLGQRTTYVSARRPARLPARDCQIRGGEYVAYDRADISSALAAWQPLAEQGDVEARVIVGEIYNRGLGVAPDHAAAAHWYRLAADAGDRRAQVNLGHLYEIGLGVERDPRTALDWYRRAAGGQATIELDTGPPQADAPPPQPSNKAPGPIPPPADFAELEQLRERERQLETSLDSLRAELEASRRALGSAQAQAASAERQAALTKSEAQSAAARAAAAEAETARVAAMPAVSAPPDRTAELVVLQQELARSQREAEALERSLQAASQANNAQLLALEQRTRDTEQARAEAAAERERLGQVAASLAERETQLAGQRAESERLGGELANATALAERQQAELQRLDSAARQQLLVGPELALIEPQVVRTRDIVPVATVQVAERRIVGRVTAPAGIVSLTVNDRAVTPNELGVFDLTLPVAAGESPVAIVAVDRQGKRSELQFVLRREAAVAQASLPAAAQASPAPAGVDFGRYHALVIGNNDYRQLPDLTSPINDATGLADVLQRRYGFRTTVLTNADRYAILSALNRLRETLTSADNLLIYYAGHGELDEVNQRGHWLPVDAERDSTANWIPTTAITDLLNIIQARQVLLVVDSCYAGALTRSAVGRLRTGMTTAEQQHWFRTMAKRKSRTVLTSGGIAPVLDAGGGHHSVFAKALLEVLEANTDILDGQRLHRDVAARVAYAAASLRFDQVPEYAPIRYAGHEAGEFFLVPGI
jgi:hypothetical protein